MQFWMEFFSIVAAIALVMQVGILIALFVELKRTTESINRIVNDLHARMGPILTRTQLLLDDTQQLRPWWKMLRTSCIWRADRRKKWTES